MAHQKNRKKIREEKKRLEKRNTKGKALQDKKQNFLYEMLGLITLGVIIFLIGLVFLLFARSWGIALMIIGGAVTGISVTFFLFLFILLSRAS